MRDIPLNTAKPPPLDVKPNSDERPEIHKLTYGFASGHTFELFVQNLRAEVDPTTKIPTGRMVWDFVPGERYFVHFKEADYILAEAQPHYWRNRDARANQSGPAFR